MSAAPSSERSYGFVSVITNGRLGQPLAVSAVMYRNGREITDEFFACLPPHMATDGYTVAQYASAMATERVITHKKCDDMLASFANWFARRNVWTTTWVASCNHLGVGHLFAELRRLDLLRLEDIPSTLLDIETLLEVADGYTSAEDYVRGRALRVLTMIENTRHPIRVCVVNAAMFFDFVARLQLKDDNHKPFEVVVVPDTAKPPPQPASKPADISSDIDELTYDLSPTTEVPKEVPQMPPPPPVVPKQQDSKTSDDTPYDEDDDLDDKKNGVPIKRPTKRGRK